MEGCKVNLACGGVFVTDRDWINLDYTPAAPGVRRADLLSRLPLPDGAARLVYASHFLEHIPRSNVPAFLTECRRVLAPGGVLRLVLPDLENLCREYLSLRERLEHDKADFVVREIIDQCVRLESGGELGCFYRQLQSADMHDAAMIEFVRRRTGEVVRPTRPLSPCDITGVDANGSVSAAIYRAQVWLSRLPRRVRGRLLNVWLRFLIGALPAAFRAQNVSLASVGERHHWLWDFHQLQDALESAGFVAIERQGCSTSLIADFPFCPLDIDQDGYPRKGAESMYVEARKPL